MTFEEFIKAVETFEWTPENRKELQESLKRVSEEHEKREWNCRVTQEVLNRVCSI